MRKGSVRNRTFAIRAGSVVSYTLMLFLENPFGTSNQLFRLRRSVPAEELQRLGLQLVGGNEEFFELFLDLGRQVPNALQLTLAVRIRRDRDDAIIADLLMLGLLYRLQHANELASQHQTRCGGGVMNDHCVDRIAILGSGRWDEAPVIGIGQTEHHDLDRTKVLSSGSNVSFARAPRGVSTTTWTSSCPAQAGSLARFGIAIRTSSRGRRLTYRAARPSCRQRHCGFSRRPCRLFLPLRASCPR